MNLSQGLDLLAECVKPLVVTLPPDVPGGSQVLIRRVMGDEGHVKVIVDLRFANCWTPIELCGGSFEVRDE